LSADRFKNGGESGGRDGDSGGGGGGGSGSGRRGVLQRAPVPARRGSGGRGGRRRHLRLLSAGEARHAGLVVQVQPLPPAAAAAGLRRVAVLGDAAAVQPRLLRGAAAATLPSRGVAQGDARAERGRRRRAQEEQVGRAAAGGAAAAARGHGGQPAQEELLVLPPPLVVVRQPQGRRVLGFGGQRRRREEELRVGGVGLVGVARGPAGGDRGAGEPGPPERGLVVVVVRAEGGALALRGLRQPQLLGRLPGAPLHRLRRLRAPARRVPPRAQAQGRAGPPGRRRGARAGPGPAPPHQVRRLLRRRPGRRGPAFVILLALGTRRRQRQRQREREGLRLAEPPELGLGAGEPHEGAQADQLLVQQEHHGRAHSRVSEGQRQHACRCGRSFMGLMLPLRERSMAGESSSIPRPYILVLHKCLHLY
jgi:hypothetical protein